jgi:hypothetical protein
MNAHGGPKFELFGNRDGKTAAGKIESDHQQPINACKTRSFHNLPPILIEFAVVQVAMCVEKIRG